MILVQESAQPRPGKHRGPRKFIAAEGGVRERLLLNRGWSFMLGDPEGAGTTLEFREVGNLHKLEEPQYWEERKLEAEEADPVSCNLGASLPWVQPAFPDRDWRSVDLPHDWMREAGYDRLGSGDQGYRAFGPRHRNSIGWYRRHLVLPKEFSGQSIWIEFDGVFRNSLVWINGHCLGRNVSGYSSFAYDVTRHVACGTRNTLVVRVDATRSEGWFYEGAGIYRHVWLVKAPQVQVARGGTFVHSEVGDGSATVTVHTTIKNDSPSPRFATLETELVDAEGHSCAELAQSEINLAPNGQTVVSQRIVLHNARLWCPETPHLYKAVSRARSGEIGCDVLETTFGIRSARFTADNGFLLNGRKVTLKGVCDHQDHAGVGVAIPDRLKVWRLERLREMGCNALRTAHNPPAPEVLDACDRLGILVIDETRRFSDSREALSQLERLIRRDRNHPSIVLWSLGNEEMPMQSGGPLGAAILSKLQELAHSLDPTRQCTIAMNGSWGEGFSKVIDVQGFNYLRLSGGPDLFHALFPRMPTVGTEEGSTVGTRGEYREDVIRGCLPAYDGRVQSWASTAEAWWKFYQARPWMSGGFVWTGFDYRGEPSPNSWPNVSSQFGIMDTCGFPKDNFFYYKAWWTDEPVLHLLPHWNWARVDRRELTVTVHSAADRVQATFNGVATMYRPLEDGVATFTVPYRPGTLRIQTISGMKVDQLANPKIEADKTVNLSETGFEARLSDVAEGTLTMSVHTPPTLPVWAHTNCDEVELFLNGRSQGRRTVEPLGHAEWPVAYEPGALEARGYRKGRWILTERVETTGSPASIRLSADRTRLRADGEDVGVITAAIVDDRGRVVPDANPRIAFIVEGGSLLGVGNGDPACHESDLGPERSAFHGLAQLIVQTRPSSGPLTVKASSPGLSPAVLVIETETTVPRPFLP